MSLLCHWKKKKKETIVEIGFLFTSETHEKCFLDFDTHCEKPAEFIF